MSGYVLQAASLVGAALILAAYAGNQMADWKSDGLKFTSMNLVGSALVAASVISPLNVGALVLEVSWSLLSLRGVVKALRRGVR